MEICRRIDRAAPVAELLIRYLLPRIKGAWRPMISVLSSHLSTRRKKCLRSWIVFGRPKNLRKKEARGLRSIHTAVFPRCPADWTLAKQMFLDWATAGNVPVIDMSSDFLSVPVSRYYLENIHPNSAGHALIAQRLIENWPHLSGAAITGKHQGTSKYSSSTLTR
jgi:hypothetical protein